MRWSIASTDESVGVWIPESVGVWIPALFQFLVPLNFDAQRDIRQIDLAGGQDGAHRRQDVAMRSLRIADDLV